MILVISIAFLAAIPYANTKEITDNSTAKGLAIINQVAGFNLTKYKVTPTLAASDQTLGNSQTENIRYALDNSKSHIEILETFTGNHLQMIDVLENHGSVQMPTSPFFAMVMAKDFLLKYQNYSINSFYGQLSSMLNREVDPTKNSTTTIGNIKFDITTTSGNSTTFTWSYTSGGINTLDKCVSLGYKEGFLKHFIDTWDLHKIGSTTVNLSEQQAEEIAMKNAKTYTWTIGSGKQAVVINNFNVTKPVVKELIFSIAGNADNTRDNDQLALYPLWHIGVGLDKYYPGNVYGIYVDIWADTGQIKGIYEVFSTLPSTTNETATIAESSIINQPSTTGALNSFPTSWIALMLLSAIALGAFPIWLLRRKTTVHSLRLPKIRKVSSAVLCILIATITWLSLVTAVPTANAAVANIWGETAAGGGYLYHTQAEKDNQTQLSSDINTWFGNAGYAHNNFQQNDQTTKSNVLYYTGYYGQIYPSVETVYFDHGVGTRGGNGISAPYNYEWHYQLCTDLTQNPYPDQNVFDYQLYSATSTANQYFSYISTCHSASLYDGNTTLHDGIHFFNGTGTYGANSGGYGIIGMPYAWTHGAILSTNGFIYPNSGPYCYIGFVEGSAALCQDVDNRQSGTATYYTFVHHFFDGLLNVHLTVNQALDYAAYQAFPPEAFAATALYQGTFGAIWPTPNDPDPDPQWGEMVVYGNGNIYLYPGGPDYVTTPSISGPTTGITNTQYQFSASATDPYGYALTYTFNWGDGSDPTVTNNPNNVPHTWTSANAYTISVTAQSQNGIQSLSPVYHYITINNPQPVYHYLTVQASSIWAGQPLDTNVRIDGNDYGTSPVTIQVLEGWHNIEVYDQVWNPYFWCTSTINGMEYNGGWGFSVPVYQDQTATAWYAP